jgi:excisionase family DNA binding protein
VKLELELTDEQLAELAEQVATLVRSEAERWLSQKELAEHLGCSVRTVSNYQRAGMPCLKVGSHPRFKASDCEAWLTARDGRAYDGVGSSNGPAPLPRPGPGHRKVGSDAKQEA